MKMLLLLSCHNVQELPLWSHNMPHLLTGTIHFTSSLKGIYSSTHTPVQPHSGIDRWHQFVLEQCYNVIRHDTHYCTIYDNITTEFSNQALCKCLQTLFPSAIV